MTTFKNKDFQKFYDTMMELASNRESELFRDGHQSRGTNGKAAFWDGYNGVKNSANAPPNTLAHAAYKAGQDYRKVCNALKVEIPK